MTEENASTSDEVVETGTEEVTQHEENNVNNVEDRLSELQAQLSQLTQALAPKKPETPKVPADLKAKLRENPDLALEIIEQQINNGIQQVTQTSQREIWDRKAEQDFPTLRKDQAFTKAVKMQIDELVAQGEYTREHPKLVYRAAQLAAAKLPRASISSSATKTPGTERVSSEAPAKGTTRTATGNKFRAPDNDPRMLMARRMLEADQRPREFKEKYLEKFRESLKSPHDPASRRQKRGMRLS